MGQVLSSPITEKHTSSGQNDKVIYGASAMQGWRVTMEDAHTTALEVMGKAGTSFFAVYDGHGGQAVAQYAGKNTHLLVVGDPEFEKGNYEAALRNGFLRTDVEIQNDPQHRNELSGCTAVSALFTPDGRVICANAGDSRCVLSSKGVAIPLSNDHKPTNPEETKRIVNAGGFVQHGRVNGNLALSRAIGDFEFKKNRSLPPEEQMVTVVPEIMSHSLTPDDEFVVLACDGIWDCMTSQEVVNFIRPRIANGQSLGSICEEIMDKCLAPECGALGIGCDNMTIMIAALLDEKGVDGLRERCATPSEAPPIPEESTPVTTMNSPFSDEEEEILADALDEGASPTSPAEEQESPSLA